MRTVTAELKGDDEHGWRYAILDIGPDQVAISPLFATVGEAEAHLDKVLANIGGTSDTFFQCPKCGEMPYDCACVA